MYSVQRLVGIALVFVAAWVGWAVLGTVTLVRTGEQEGRLGSQVAELWGAPQLQTAPVLTFRWKEKRNVEKTSFVDDKITRTTETVEEEKSCEEPLASTRISADLHLDERRKGLLWYPLYGVDFDGRWTYVHGESVPGTLDITFRFPDPNGLYRRLPSRGRRHRLGPKRAAEERRRVDSGRRHAGTDRVDPGRVPQPRTRILALLARVRGRAPRRFPAADADRLPRHRLPAALDGAEREGRDRRRLGPDLAFRARDHRLQIGMSMPNRIQPGELAAALSFSAPISLLFFFLLLVVLGRLRGFDIHPINYLFLAGAFFSFHLLFAYTVDHMSIAPAFAISSAVSVFLVIRYLRLVVSARFAFVEAGAAQLVYLIGFSLAHFLEGYTGLAVTLLSIVTLFLLMQLTAKLRCDEVIGRPRLSAS